MKSSKYNLFIPTPNKGEQIVYNIMTGSTFVVDKEGMEIIKNSTLDLLDHKTQQTLLKNGLILDDNTIEKQILKTKYSLAKYGPSKKAVLTLMITYNCNFSCPYCYLNFYNLPKKSINEDYAHLIAKFIRNFVSQNSYKELMIVFYGGEPLLNIRNGAKIIEVLGPWLKKERVKLDTRVITNGTLLTKDIINLLSSYNTSFQITLDGPAKIHDQRRPFKNGKGSYATIMTAMNLLKKQDINFSIRVNVDRENISCLDSLLDDLMRRFGKGISLRFYQLLPCNNPRACHNSFCLKGRQIGAIADLWKSAYRKGFDLSLKPLLNYVYCESLTSHSFTIGPEGEVYKCWGLLGLKHQVGVINEQGHVIERSPLYDIMSQDPFEWEKCKNCKYLPTCGGGCISMSYDWYGTYHKGYCPEERYLIKERIKFELKRQFPTRFKDLF